MDKRMPTPFPDDIRDAEAVEAASLKKGSTRFPGEEDENAPRASGRQSISVMPPASLLAAAAAGGAGDAPTSSIVSNASTRPTPTGGVPPARPPRPREQFKLLRKRHEFTEEQDMLLRASGVTFGKTERATKFAYDPVTGTWKMESCRLRIAEKWFSEGGMRRSYRAAELSDASETMTQSCVKLFKEETKPGVVFHEALTQAVSSVYAQAFNNICEKKGLDIRVRFLPVWVLLLSERFNSKGENVYATLEPFLPGTYVKFSDNSGRHLNDAAAEVAQSFSHYTFLASARRLVCVDIQGVVEMKSAELEPAPPSAAEGGRGPLPPIPGAPGADTGRGPLPAIPVAPAVEATLPTLPPVTPTASGGVAAMPKTLTLTDPQIHSVDGQLFGAGNLGVSGIKAFVHSYKRTQLDELLGLAPLTAAQLVGLPEASENDPRLGHVDAKGRAHQALPVDTAELAARLAADSADLEEDARKDVESARKLEQARAHLSKLGIDRAASQKESLSKSRFQEFSRDGVVSRLSFVARDYACSISEV